MGISSIFALLILLGGSLGIPMGLPPGPEDPVMSRVAPDDCVFYASWSGVQKIDPKDNPTEKWMGQPTVSKALAKIRKAYRGMLLNRNQKNQDPFVRRATAIAVDVVDAASTEPAAFYLNQFQLTQNKLDLKGAVVISLGNHADQVGKQFERLLSSVPPNGKDRETAAKANVLEIAGKPAIKLDLPDVEFPVYVAVWGEYFVVGLGDGALAKLDIDWKTPQPKWLAEMRQRLDVKRIASLGYMNAAALTKEVFTNVDTANFFAIQPLKNLSEEFKSVSWISGVDANGFLTRSDVQIFENKTGITSVLGEDPIPQRFLTDFPADPMVGFATRLSTQAILDFIKSTATDVGQKQALEDSLQEFQKLTGVKLETELLDAVGDFVYAYYNFEMANLGSGWVISVRIEDEMSFPAIFDQLNKGLKNWVDNQQSGLKFRVEKIGQYDIYSVSEQGGAWNNFAWSLIEQEWYFARSPQEIVKHLDGQPKINQLTHHSAIKEMFELGNQEGLKGPVAISSLNLPPILKLVHPFIAGALANQQGNNRIHPDLDFDLADIPSLDEMVNGAQPNFSAVYRTETGYQIFQRQTYPGASPPVSFFAIAAGMIPYAMAEFDN